MEGFKAVCIRSYIDEDDLKLFKMGEIELEECKVYKKGEVYTVYPMYDRKYFKRINEKS